jgi:hypothetical protein
VGPEQAGLVADLWADGFELPPGPQRETARAIRMGWFLLPENRRYLAWLDGKPVAMAALYMSDGIGFLNVGATLPAFRGLGCHSLLVRERIRASAAAGCDWAMGHTGFGGQSQRNEERAGLRVAYTPVTMRARAAWSV